MSPKKDKRSAVDIKNEAAVRDFTDDHFKKFSIQLNQAEIKRASLSKKPIKRKLNEIRYET